MNRSASVLQEVVRTRLEQGAGYDEWKDELRRLALHVNHWLSSATHNHEVTKAHQLAPHAVTLIAHLQRLGLADRHIALLMGNMADIYLATGRDDEAIDLLQNEITTILNYANGVDVFLEHQARLHLARALVDSDHTARLDPHPALTELARVLAYAQMLALNDDTHEAAAKFCVASLSILSFLHDQTPATDKSNALVTVFSSCRSVYPTPPSPRT